MKKSTNSSTTHINVETATTLNRRYVHRPASFTTYKEQEQSPQSATTQLQAEALRRRQALADQINRQNLARLNRASAKAQHSQQPQPLKIQVQQPRQPHQQPQSAKKQPRQIRQPRQSDPSTILLAQAAKNRATESALQTAALQSVATSEMDNTTTTKKSKKSLKASKNKGRFFIALAASTACVVALGIIVKFNMPDLSVRVAAMQTGIEATYPSYIPSGFQLSGVSTGRHDTITMDFSGESGKSFQLSEEKSAWDSNALLNNYVKSTWGTDYSVVREQGITIYLSNSDATWVNGGILYHLTTPSADTLTKKEIKNIVTSL